MKVFKISSTLPYVYLSYVVTQAVTSPGGNVLRYIPTTNASVPDPEGAKGL